MSLQREENPPEGTVPPSSGETNTPGQVIVSSAKPVPRPESRPKTGKASGTETESQQTNVKETVESILVAFILAFVFRAFVVEAFVIPTGSMAPTLYGAHMAHAVPGLRLHV